MGNHLALLPHVYVAYAVILVGLTVWLARTLSKSGAVYLRDVFPGRPDLAEAVNRLLVVGFYLVNLGYGTMALSGGAAADPRQAIEALASKLGHLLMALAVAHFANMFVLHRIRRRAILRAGSVPPVAPEAFAAAPAPAAAA